MITRGTVRIAEERVDQLRQLAAEQNKSIIGLIEEWIATAWHKAGHDEVLPGGFKITRSTTAHVSLAADGLPTVELEKDEAQTLAQALIDLANATRKSAIQINETQHGNYLIEVRRQGKGMVYVVNGRKSNMTYSLARDLGEALKAS